MSDATGDHTDHKLNSKWMLERNHDRPPRCLDCGERMTHDAAQSCDFIRGYKCKACGATADLYPLIPHHPQVKHGPT